MKITIALPPLLERQIDDLRATVRRKGGPELTVEEAVLLATAEGLEKFHELHEERLAG